MSEPVTRNRNASRGNVHYLFGLLILGLYLAAVDNWFILPMKFVNGTKAVTLFLAKYTL